MGGTSGNAWREEEGAEEEMKEKDNIKEDEGGKFRGIARMEKKQEMHDLHNSFCKNYDFLHIKSLEENVYKTIL